MLPQFFDYYQSPLGLLLIAADGKGLIGLWFAGQKYYASTLGPNAVKQATPVLQATKTWLDHYFTANSQPAETPPFHLIGTPFQLSVWQILTAIPFGQTTTYGAIAQQIAKQTGAKVSAQAVGTAVGKNPISIIVPCHRVLNAKHQLSGYAAGLDKKLALLRHEGIDKNQNL